MRGACARISPAQISVTDVYDPVTTFCPYLEPTSLHSAVTLIRAQGGVRFDPQVAVTFANALSAIIRAMHASFTD